MISRISSSIIENLSFARFHYENYPRIIILFYNTYENHSCFGLARYILFLSSRENLDYKRKPYPGTLLRGGEEGWFSFSKRKEKNGDGFSHACTKREEKKRKKRAWEGFEIYDNDLNLFHHVYKSKIVVDLEFWR